MLITINGAAALATAKRSALARIDTYSKAKRAEIAGTSDDAEIAGWTNKLRIAQAILAGTATPNEILTFETEISIRSLPGETLDVFVSKVVNNAARFGQAVALIDGIKRRATDAVAAAQSTDEVAAVLVAVKAQAEAAYTDLMQSSGG